MNKISLILVVSPFSIPINTTIGNTVSVLSNASLWISLIFFSIPVKPIPDIFDVTQGNNH